MKQLIIAVAIIAVLMALALPGVSAAAAYISIYTDSDTYQAGDTIEVSLSGSNDAEGMQVDVYIGLLRPDGGLLTLGELEWTHEIQPWIHGLYLPGGYMLGESPFFRFDLPSEAPPIDLPGDFCFLAGLTQPDTLDFVSDIAVSAFEVVQVTRHFYVDVVSGDDANDGSEDCRWQSITHAIDVVIAHELSPVDIHVASGTYYDREGILPLRMKSWVSLIADGPGAIVDAENQDANVLLAVDVHNATIDGFTITGASGGIFRPTHPGGAIWCEDSSILICNNTIVGNFGVGPGGGGIFCMGGSPEIVNNVISWNAVDDANNNYHGGGIHCHDSAVTIVNNTISNNEARFGGGIYIWTYSSENAVREISNNTLVDNAADIGAGICEQGFVDVNIADCIVWGGFIDGEDLFFGDILADFCCIKGGHFGEGNIDLDPLFAERPLGELRYYLNPNSPCIDAGSRTAEEAWLSGMTTQTNGTPDTGIVDMGAHYPIPD